MDRFYLEKLIDDINAGVKNALEAELGNRLTWFMALDQLAETGEGHLKMLRYLYALDPQCPVSGLNRLPAGIGKICQRFSGSDYHCSFHFGSDDWTPPREKGYAFGLQFYLVEHGESHKFNHLLAAGMLDDPHVQGRQLPPWLRQGAPLDNGDLANEILCFTQQFVSPDSDDLFRVRRLEAAFWRVVNLACMIHNAATYEDLADLMPVRYKEHSMELPDLWDNLRQKEAAFGLADLDRCRRYSLRFCSRLMELS